METEHDDKLRKVVSFELRSTSRLCCVLNFQQKSDQGVVSVKKLFR
jgi:hypothetical protein